MTGMPTDFLFSPMATPAPAIPAPLSGTAAAYNQGNLGLYHYDTGTANRGALASPIFAFPSNSLGFEVAFDYVKETEGGGSGSFDQCFVDARRGPGEPWASALQIAGNQPCGSGGTTVTIGSAVPPLADLLEAGMGQVRLRFDTVNAAANGFPGWTVDHVAVTARPGNFATPFASACTSALGCVPSLATSGIPYAGNLGFRLDLTGADGGAAAIFLVGASTTSPPCSFPVPFAISSLLPGNLCTVAICPDVTIGTFTLPPGAACSGSLSLPLPIPPGFATGGNLLFQAVVVNPATLPAPDSLSLTAALDISVL
jgi:hypothetical protein